jgi:PAS domain S-box-containing protein
MTFVLENKLLEKHWLKEQVWRATSIVILIVALLTSSHFGGWGDVKFWLFLSAFSLMHLVANVYIAQHRVFGSLVYYGSALLFLNFIGPMCPVENGLVFVYPMLAVSAMVTLKERHRLYPTILLGFISFCVYMMVKPMNSEAVLMHPRLNFVCATICTFTALISVLAYSKMWKLRQNQVAKKYDQLKSFVNFVNESPLPLMRVNTEGEILLTNRSAESLFAKADGSGINYPPGCSQLIIEAFQQNESKKLKTQINGRTLQLVITPNRQLGYVNLYGEDITSIEKAMQRITELSNAIDQLADGMAIFNKEGQLEYVNASFAEILGYNHTGQLLEKQWSVMCDPEWLRHYNENILPNLKLERVWRGEASCVKFDKSTLDAYITMTMVPGGKTVCYLKDYTEIKKYQNDLIEARDEAEEAAKAKSEFLATMSHEIRTPMNGVLGMASLLGETKMSVTQREYLDTILYSGDQLMNIINEILDFSKLEAGKMELDEGRVHLVHLIERSMRIATHQASVRNNILTSHVAHTVPGTIMADGARITQIVNNLINNALKFTKNGKVHIELSAKEGDEFRQHMIFIKVSDSGIGIAQEKVDSLFEAFTQADSSTTRKYGGTGLGLSICKHLIEMMGGEISLESELGVGSSFTVSFPAIAVPNDDGREEEFHYRYFESELASKFPMTVLVAEDNFINQKLAEQVFNNMGYQIDIVENGLLALEACQSKHYDIVFMDVHMPELDGLQATQRILSEVVDPPVIVALSANVVEESQQECVDVGMSGFIQKPFKLDDIAKVLVTYCTRARKAS